MEQKTCHKLIFKLHSKQLKNAKWDLTLDISTAMRECPDCVVALSDSQALRFIDEINGVSDITEKVNRIYKRIHEEKKKQRGRESKATIRWLYESLYDLQFQKDYVCVIMDSNSDYDRANKGFKINGISYRRLLGTNGGIKNSTIVYVSEKVYPEMKTRMDNGRDKTKEIVPAKLEAYQALICSGSTPLPKPRGFIVVKDCVTKFTDNVIMLNDECDGEPDMQYIENYEMEHDNSDGYGLMSPEYSRIVNGYLTGDSEHTISGMNTRYAWNKGMVYTFPFVEFAEKVAGSFYIEDVWGVKRDVREADIILTESMLKLWDSYDSWESYYENCEKNHYQFSTPKITPAELENVRDTNYQFLQSYEFTDDEIRELCKPTFDEINDAMGLDYRKSLVFLAGYGVTDDNADNPSQDYSVRALMANPYMINDSFIRRRIWNMIEKRTEMAKRGAIRVNANYAMISGDPYSLCQSMFGLPITGLLKRGEVYHKYWSDRGAQEIVCFRAPMTCHNNIRKMKLCFSELVRYWYRYIETAMVYNSWDTACDAMNGADFDGDTNMTTDNTVLLAKTRNSPTIMCVQRKAKKIVPTEDDIILSNKLAFNDDIGIVTNHVTSMIEVQSGFPVDSDEYRVLGYRIMCGQLYQQNTIDRAKGVIAKSMPTYWYSYRDTIVRDEDTDEVIEKKNFNRKIVADTKPYFMTYVYPSLKTKNNKYLKNCRGKAIRLFSSYGIRSIEDLYAYEPKTQEMIDFIAHYESHMEVGNNACVINRICWLAEEELRSFSKMKIGKPSFDYSVMKSNVPYSEKAYREIFNLAKEYKLRMMYVQKKLATDKAEKYINTSERSAFVSWFKKEAEKICPNEDELCDIILDVCYKSDGMKSMAWDICGDVILRNLLSKNGNNISYPVFVDGKGDFTFGGRNFVMQSKKVEHEQHYTE